MIQSAPLWLRPARRICSCVLAPIFDGRVSIPKNKFLHHYHPFRSRTCVYHDTCPVRGCVLIRLVMLRCR